MAQWFGDLALSLLVALITAVAWVPPLARELPHTLDVAKKTNKRTIGIVS